MKNAVLPELKWLQQRMHQPGFSLGDGQEDLVSKG
jgi:hypothetical protein